MLKIKSTEFITSGTNFDHYPIHEQPEIVFLGRSNVGKSTFINSFVNQKRFAYVSSSPGKTQVLNFFHLNKEFFLVDVPGYGYAKVSKKMREEFGIMIENYLTLRENLKFAVLLIDFKVGPTEDDKLMYEFLRFHNIKTLVIATKKDKVKQSLHSKNKKIVLTKLEGLSPEMLNVYSKEDRNTLNPIYDFFEKNIKQINTGEINSGKITSGEADE